MKYVRREEGGQEEDMGRSWERRREDRWDRGRRELGRGGKMGEDVGRK